MGKTQAKPIPFSQEQLKELLTYEPDTGKFFWNHLEDGHGYHKMSAGAWNNQFGGKQVGSRPTKTRSGYQYLTVFICGKHYKAHRVAWKWISGEEPPEFIDHEDRNGLNNRWDNPRDGTGTTNQWNRSIQFNNKSGCSGVHQRSDSGKWRTTFCANNQKKTLGSFNTKEEAIEALKAAREEAGFEDDHGTIKAFYRQEKDTEEEVKMTTSTGITNITYSKKPQKYTARSTVEGKRKTIGHYDTLEEACLELLEFRIDKGLPIEETQIAMKHLNVMGG